MPCEEAISVRCSISSSSASSASISFSTSSSAAWPQPPCQQSDAHVRSWTRQPRQSTASPLSWLELESVSLSVSSSASVPGQQGCWSAARLTSDILDTRVSQRLSGCGKSSTNRSQGRCGRGRQIQWYATRARRSARPGYRSVTQMGRRAAR